MKNITYAKGNLQKPDYGIDLGIEFDNGYLSFCIPEESIKKILENEIHEKNNDIMSNLIKYCKRHSHHVGNFDKAKKYLKNIGYYEEDVNCVFGV